MTVCTFSFVFGAFFVAMFFFLLPVPLRRWIFTLASALFLWTLVPNLSSWATLAAFLVSGWGVAYFVARKPSKSLLTGYLAVLLAAFVVLKKYAILRYFVAGRILEHPIGIVGLSFMLFRQIHFTVDSMEGQIQPFPSLWVYLNYQLSLFTLLSGPIQRFNDFRAWWEDPRPVHQDRHGLLWAILRVLVGVVLISLVAGFCQKLVHRALPSIGVLRMKDCFWVLVVFYAFPAYVFFNFLGYCEIVVGAASLFGLKLPENFNRPFFARNMIDYWGRWHITLSEWIRDYVFTPLYTALVRRRPTHAQFFAMVCYFVALFLAGVWHGATLNFVAFGLLNALGVAAAKLWEIQILNTGGRGALRRYLQSPRIGMLATIATFHFACFTMMFFTPDLALVAIAHLLRR